MLLFRSKNIQRHSHREHSIDMRLEEIYPDQKEAIQKAESYARQKHSGQRRKSGEPFVSHPLAVAQILAKEGLGADTVVAGILHDTVEDTDATIEEIEQGWGKEIADLVQGITKVERATEDERRTETYRKLLLAAASDARVLVIKLADRLHNMRTIEALPISSQKRVAEETLLVYTPIAHRLGLGTIQHELEDRALRILRPDDYRQAAAIQRERKTKGSREIRRLQGQLRRALQAAGIEDFQIKSRIKSIYSIAEKLKHRQGTEIWDVLGIRIVLQGRADCYRALGIVHEIWKPLPEQFDDYIAVPRGGLYQSLHTTVMTSRGRPLEVQIRSQSMDKLAEHGLAAHWLYKEDLRSGGPQETRRYIHQAARAEELGGTSLEEIFEDLRRDAFAREIYLFTPQGDVRFLPEGSTAIDFAYSIHSEVGSHCAGSRVDGKLFPLGKPLPSGSQVEIITDPETSPRPDWLDVVQSPKARSRIRAQLADAQSPGKASDGWERIRESLCSQGMKPLADNLFESLERAGYTDLEETGLRALRNRTMLREITRQIIRASGQVRKPQERSAPPEEEIEIEGMGGVLVRRAGCCNPLPGEPIIGYVSLGRGVSVHRQDCRSVEEWQKSVPERLLQARWQDHTVVLRIRVSMWAHEGVLQETVLALEERGDEIETMNVRRQGRRLEISCEIRLARKENQETIEAALRALPGFIGME